MNEWMNNCCSWLAIGRFISLCGGIMLSKLGASFPSFFLFYFSKHVHFPLKTSHNQVLTFLPTLKWQKISFPAKMAMMKISASFLPWDGRHWTKQIGPGLAGSCEDCSRLVSPARQARTSTPRSAQPNSNCSTGSNPTNFTYCGHCFL